MKTCVIQDCTSAKNNCKICQYANRCDYVWVEKLWKEGGNLLTPLIPVWVKASMRNNKIVSYTGINDFCVISVPKKTNYITVQDICVSRKFQNRGIAKQLLSMLMCLYDRHIQAKCVKDSSAEVFWSRIGVKLSEENSKKRIVCTYKVLNATKKYDYAKIF